MSNVSIDDSILISIKKQLNIDRDDTAFDSDVLYLINSNIAVLTQLGIGPADGFSITGQDDKWSDFVSENTLNMAFEHLFLRVKRSFDPPNGSVLTSMENVIKELDWRLAVAGEEAQDA